MEVAYYPGCSAHGTGREQDISTRAVCAALGIELHELDDWNCCGSTAAHAIAGDLADSLSVRNLEIAAGQGRDLLVPCAACYANLTTAAAHCSSDLTRKIGDRMNPRVLSLSNLLARDKFRQRILKRKKVNLESLRAVPYYGCLLVRHGGETEESVEDPVSIDRLMEVCGVTVREWSQKTTCCGGSLSISSPGITSQLSLNLVDHAVRAGADCIVTACPMCHMNLESQQWIRQHNKGTPPEGSKNLPVLYVTELVGLALGLPEIHRCLKRHLIDTQSVLSGRETAHA